MKSRTRFRPSSVNADASIDATPVMNMFVILIPFLVSMAAFSQLAVQRLALPGNEAAESAQTEDDAPLLVSVTRSEIVAMRGNRIIGTVERQDASAELSNELTPLLEEARQLFPRLDHVTLALADDVVCADVVTCFDVCRETGFIDVGVAEATQ